MEQPSGSQADGQSAPDRLAVWVVEDNRRLRDSLVAVLQAQDDMYCPLALESCEDYLTALEQDEPPDIVLMDIGLPGASGIDGVRQTSSWSPTTKVVILTIHAEDERVFTAICAGASGYLVKPTDPAEIVTAIRDVQRGMAPINPYIAKKILGLFARLAPPKAPAGEYGLTRREHEILQHLVEGLTMKAIARDLDLSYHTISNHLRNIYAKLHVRSRSSAVAKALREDLL
jgi:DNA-binding NarL/FixJ family response regulator